MIDYVIVMISSPLDKRVTKTGLGPTDKFCTRSCLCQSVLLLNAGILRGRMMKRLHYLRLTNRH